MPRCSRHSDGAHVRHVRVAPDQLRQTGIDEGPSAGGRRATEPTIERRSSDLDETAPAHERLEPLWPGLNLSVTFGVREHGHEALRSQPEEPLLEPQRPAGRTETR
jgi:hypothetical protein